MRAMDFQEAWSFLDRLQFFKIKLGLDSMNHFLGSLNNPHHNLACVHIGGTNGKGSVGATLLSILNQSGYKVGFYTSPHLNSVRERFKINDSYISEDEFASGANKIKRVLEGRRITYFEFTTTLALLWFAEQKVDLAIMEVGMGGRLDATNVIRPLVSVITNVSIDHEQYLGSTLGEIAREKAGIIKDKVPVVSGADNDTARQIIEKRCRKHQSPFYLFDRDFQINQHGGTKFFASSHNQCMKIPENYHASLSCLRTKNKDGANNTWNYRGISTGTGRPPWKLYGLPMALNGHYQINNSAIALAALELLTEQGFTIKEDDIHAGLGRVTWPGRLEEFWHDKHNNVYRKHPQNISRSLRHFLLDGAHNKAGITALKEALSQSFARNKLILIWAAMADKDFASTLPSMAKMADTLILTRPENERSADTKQLKNTLPQNIQTRVYCLADVKDALQKAIELADARDLICVAGSLYLVGKARRHLLGDLVEVA